MLLDRATWNAVQPLLDHALELSEPERERYVQSLSESDPDMATLLASLLQSDGAARTPVVLHRLAADAPPREARLAEAWHAGARVGAYALDTLIGRGGMGEVWRANRVDGRFEGAVAIKFLATEHLTRADESRFRREGVALARLTHPGIARLLDAGISDGGTPFLVLELVDGQPLNVYCDQRSLDVPARVRLTCDVLDAVAHAHAQLVVHRDLKPSNILVTGEGQVKLLDFGIATLLDPQSIGAATTPDARALTPAYASPEQVSGAPASTSTDVYSVGVVLYQLLTGRHPTAEGASTAGDILRRIAKGDVVRPSHALNTAADHGSAIAKQRRSTPAALSRRLQGDLDIILERALSLEPHARYASAADFADDLRRHLTFRPVRARPDAVSYRLSRFVRRNPAGVGLGALALCGIAAASGIAFRESARAREQRDAALAQAEQLRATNDFQFFLLSQVGQDGLTLAEMLARADKLLRTYAMPLQARANLLAQVAEQYEAIGSDSLAMRTSRRVDSLMIGVPEEEIDPSVDIYAADLYAKTGKVAEAAERLARGRARRARTAVSSPALLAAEYIATSVVFRKQKAIDSAMFYGEAAVRLLEANNLQSTNRYLTAVQEASMSYSLLGKRRRASEVSEALIPAFAATGGELSLNAVITHANIAVDRQRLGELTLADQYAGEARRRLGIVDSTGALPPQFQLTLANQAVLQERWDEATSHWNGLTAVATKLENGFLKWRAQAGLARTYASRGDATRARQSQRAALATLGTIRPNPRDSTALDGLILLAEQQPARALVTLDRYFSDSLKGSASSDFDTIQVALWRAEAALAAASPTRAVEIARGVVERARSDSLSPMRSAFWGKARTLEALALSAAGDQAAACATVRSARAPVTFGFAPSVRMIARRDEAEQRLCSGAASP